MTAAPLPPARGRRGAVMSAHTAPAGPCCPVDARSHRPRPRVPPPPRSPAYAPHSAPPDFPAPLLVWRRTGWTRETPHTHHPTPRRSRSDGDTPTPTLRTKNRHANPHPAHPRPNPQHPGQPRHPATVPPERQRPVLQRLTPNPSADGPPARRRDRPRPNH